MVNYNRLTMIFRVTGVILTLALNGAILPLYGLSNVSRRQPANILRTANRLKFQPFKVQRSFAEADFRLTAAKAQQTLTGLRAF